MKSFQGKVALITGGGSGIGRATAVAFLAGPEASCITCAMLNVDGGQNVNRPARRGHAVTTKFT